MKKILALALLAGCHSDKDRIASLEKRIDTLEHARPTAAAAPPRRPGPDPATVYYLPVHDTDVVAGPADAKVTVVEGFDFACPYCAMNASVMEQVQKARPQIVRVVSKNYVVHPQVATDAAVGACAAQKQNRGPEYERAVWAQAWGTSAQPHLDAQKLSADAIKEAAKSVGLNTQRFAADLVTCHKTIADEEQELNAVGVAGTPTFFVNGHVYQGPRTVEGFLAAIDAAAQKADASGIAGAAYYESLMKDAKRSL